MITKVFVTLKIHKKENIFSRQNNNNTTVAMKIGFKIESTIIIDFFCYHNRMSQEERSNRETQEVDLLNY